MSYSFSNVNNGGTNSVINVANGPVFNDAIINFANGPFLNETLAARSETPLPTVIIS